MEKVKEIATVKVSVVIPFFQRRTGILRRAVESILAQSLPPHCLVDIIIVDDGSPVPARDEIGGVIVAAPFQVIPIEQANAGVSGARNAGLDAIRPDTRYVAFLDSDDIWHPQHLARGLQALAAGADFYYANHSRRGLFDSHYLANDLAVLQLSPAPECGENIFSVSQRGLFTAVLRAIPTHCSAVLFAMETLGGLRFERQIKAAGEDVLFMAQLVERAKKILFCLDVLVECADGINLFYSAFADWDSPQRIAIAYDRLATYTMLQTRLNLSGGDAAWVQDHIAAYRRDLIWLCIRRVAKSLSIPPELGRMRELSRFYPAAVMKSLAEVLALKALGRYVPRS